jgi:hypothetical protein
LQKRHATTPNTSLSPSVDRSECVAPSESAVSISDHNLPETGFAVTSSVYQAIIRQVTTFQAGSWLDTFGSTLYMEEVARPFRHRNLPA